MSLWKPTRSMWLVASILAGNGLTPSQAEPPPKSKSPQSREVITRETAGRLAPMFQLDHDVTRIVRSSDGEQIALVQWERPVLIFDANNLQYRTAFGEGKRICDFAFSPTPDTIAYSESKVNEVTIVDLGSGKSMPIPTLATPTRLSFSPDGKLLATASHGRAAQLWSTSTRALVSTIEIDRGEGEMTCAFNSDGSMIAVGNRNGQTFIFDVARAKLGLRFFGPRFHEVAFHPTKRLIAIALADGRIWLKTTENLDAPFSSPVAGGDLRNLDWSPNGQLLATGGRNSKIILWDSEKLTILQQLDAPEWVSSVCFTPDGTQLLVAGGTEMPSADRAVTVWGVP